MPCDPSYARMVDIDGDKGMPVWAAEVSTGDAKPCNIAPMPATAS